MKLGMDLKSLKGGQALALVAAALVLFALWTAWGGWQRLSATRLQATSEQARKATADKLRPMLSTLVQRATSLQGRVAMINAVKAGDAGAARTAAQQTVPGTEAVELHPLDLSTAYANLDAFGYGKLALLERAAAADKPVVAVVKDAGGARIGVAFRV
jgi:phosphomannomutase/phosphoglucomutase